MRKIIIVYFLIVVTLLYFSCSRYNIANQRRAVPETFSKFDPNKLQFYNEEKIVLISTSSISSSTGQILEKGIVKQENKTQEKKEEIVIKPLTPCIIKSFKKLSPNDYEYRKYKDVDDDQWLVTADFGDDIFLTFSLYKIITTNSFFSRCELIIPYKDNGITVQGREFQIKEGGATSLIYVEKFKSKTQNSTKTKHAQGKSIE